MLPWWAKVGAAVAIGGGAYLLFIPAALATEDESGEKIDPKQAGIPTGGKSLGARAVEVLQREVEAGGRGDPKGSHRGPVPDKILTGVYSDGKGLLGKPWCARTLRYGYEKAAQELGLPPPFASLKGASLAGVDEWRRTFKDYYSTSPRPGMAALIVTPTTHHATMVARVLDPNTILTVEGNHGDAMANVKRPVSSIAYFIDVERFIDHTSKPAVAGLLGLDVFAARVA
jgi:hypothetical protein